MDRGQRSTGGVGSVRRAREMMQSNEASQEPPSRIPQGGYRDSTRAYQQSPQKPRQPMPAALSATRGIGQSVGAAISRPTQVPQWPLAAPVENTNDQRQLYGQPNYQAPGGRGPAPQRPPRPRNVPSMLDASKIQDHTPSFQYRAVGPPPQQRQQEDDMMSPDMRSPMSRPSTTSSVGTIPDFPMPLPPLVAANSRRSGNLGPPPSARRGASSYYSNASFVSPIPEESPRTNRSHGSYASSAAMPSRWEDDVRDDRYYEADICSDDQLSPGSAPASPDPNDQSSLVRSASFGRKGKANVVTMGKIIERSDMEMRNVQPQTSNKLAKMGVFGPGIGGGAPVPAAAMKRPAANTLLPEDGETRWPNVGDVNSPLASGTGFIDSSSSSESVPTFEKVVTADEPLPSTKNIDPRISQILAATQAASRNSAISPPTLDRNFTRLSAIRRPPKLDIDAVREAEARGSLTSLPDLIRRATKLAAMMERGKRPASRLALGDFSDEDLALEKEMGGKKDKRQSTLSGMLAAFPPPGLNGTPDPNSPNRRDSLWPSPMVVEQRDKSPRPQRRCCGLPIWGFLAIAFFTLVIIAAAVVVPLELLVLHKPKAGGSAVSQLAACQANTTCDNGGTVVLISDVCSCICANGFTGATCTTGGNASCSTININGTSAADTAVSLTYSNVTVGSAIPRLISSAQTNFSIPLNGETILGKLNADSLSCDAENALVTFDGMSSRVGAASARATSSPVSTPTPSIVTGTGTFVPKEKRGSVSIPISEITTPLGATPSPTTTPQSLLTANPTTTGAAGAYPTSTGGAASTTSFSVTQETLDFARVAVLYILQTKDVDTAVTAQGDLQRILSAASTSGGTTTDEAANVDAGNGVVVDLVNLKITVDGVTVGGGAPAETGVPAAGKKGRRGSEWLI